MLERVDKYLEDAGLYSGWTPQLEIWNDSDTSTDRFLVLQSNGGTALSKDLGSDKYFYLHVIGKRGQSDVEEARGKALEITNYIVNNPIDSCVNFIQMQGDIPRPALTEEKRVVYMLMFRVVA